MKEAPKKQHKVPSHLFGFWDGFNFGMGFWFAFVALPITIAFVLLIIFFISWLVMLVLGLT